ncbi:MAG: hypothetical protein AB8U61_05775 [Rickettsiales endosymbiont of Dermacentor nuttalli]
MGFHLLPANLQNIVDTKTSNFLQLLFSTPIVLCGGWPFFAQGLKSAVNRNFNMFTLLSISIGIAYIYNSLIAIFLKS